MFLYVTMLIVEHCMRVEYLPFRIFMMFLYVTMLIVEYAPFRIFMVFLLIKVRYCNETLELK